MADALARFWNNGLIHVVDILLLSFVIYRILVLFHGTRAVQVLRGWSSWRW
ncbi:MAG: hypothetical protein IPK56_11235 [Elusimicrobia bacterium]|nr:hypothetical protein [Elusimicrobiota bacterium]